MSVVLYDEAFIEKLRNWTLDTGIHVYGPSSTRDLIQTLSDESNDSSIELPVIALRRRGGFTIKNPSKRPMTFDGATLNANHEIASQLNAIPITIGYQIDIYTRYLNEAYEYARNIVFNIINYPRLTINIPYNNENYKHDSNITLQSNIEDTSDIPERLVEGQFTRLSLKIDIDDAYLFDVRYRDVYSINIETEWSDNDMNS
jgi:hypothetical protein